VRIPEPPDLPSPIAQQLPPALGAVPQAPPPPPAPSPSKPKIAFEKPGVASGSPAASGTAPRVAAPSSKVDEAIQSVTRSGRPGAVVVGDGTDAPGGIGEGLNLPGAPGRMGSSLELLSDPAGVDFRPYLIRILSAVRRNWFAVIPESVRFGRRGRTVIQFAINRDGSVPKLVIAVPSGAEPLDRAAVAGISATNPFPPLPAEFRGSEIRLQFIFNYNMPVR